MAALSPPFVLLDDARPDGAGARLYQAPVEIIRADTIDAVAPALTALRRARARGLEAAGYLAYEAGAAFEPALGTPAKTAGPLLWFGVFDGFTVPGHDALHRLLGDPAGIWIGAAQPMVDRAGHAAQVAALQQLIADGDIYQANLTYRARVPFLGDPLALYARLRTAAGAGFGAIVATGDTTLLSLSPELFFTLAGDALLCRPMKGTARRGASASADDAAATALRADAKQRAENLMIVDLMRNDLARVAVPGSVAVPQLFEIERYPTVHQMVSEVTATLAPGRDAIDVLAALFPCGSITGAPKIRAMQAIAQVERDMPARGAYCGAIGRLDAAGDALFNVAIRTLTIAGEAPEALIGTGGGIVADSQSPAEWDEAQAKTAFLAQGARRFDLIETMAFDPDTGLQRLDSHLARLHASAEQFGFALDRHAARNELQAATFRLRAASRVRLLLSPSGAIAIETAPAPPPPPGPVPVAIAPLPVASSDFRLRHKTSDRGFYDDARHASGAFEVVFCDRDGFLTEGSFTSVFAQKNGVLTTPPLARGLLPGVLRADLLAANRGVEGDLTADDLRDGFFIGNALRGLITAFVAP